MAGKISVLYDEVAFNQPFGGVAKYFAETIRHLPTDVKAILPLRTTQCTYLWDSPFSIPKATHTFWNFLPWLKVRGKNYLYRWMATAFPFMPASEHENQREFRKLLKRGDFDVLHLTASHWHRDDWKLVYGKKPIVITIHDLIPDIVLGYDSIRQNRTELLKHVDHIIAVSEWTKRQIVETYGTDPGKITVIHHGHEAADPSVGKNPFPGMRYLLYVGARSGYKNFALFSRAAARIMSERKDLHLICTHGVLTDDERRPFAQAGVADRVHAAFVDELDLYHLYANAELFVYPSKQEGFGMPIVDAFAAGCPVLLANASCFPEVGGDAAAYFDPDDEVQLGQLVKHIMDDAAMRSAMVKLGKVRAKCFDWGVSGRKTADVYRKVCE